MKCPRCNAPSFGNVICPRCGADLSLMRSDTAYLYSAAVQSRAFRAMRDASRLFLIIYAVSFVGVLFSGYFRPSVVSLLTAIGIYLLVGRFNRFGESAVPRAPFTFFTVSACINSVIMAFGTASCIGVCLGGKKTIEFLMSLVEKYSGMDMASEFVTVAESAGLSVSVDMFYTSLYFVCVIGMFVCAGQLLMSCIELMFFSSVKQSVNTNRPQLGLSGPFAVIMLIKGILSLFSLIFAVTIFDIALFSVTGYMYICAYKCMSAVNSLNK